MVINNTMQEILFSNTRKYIIEEGILHEPKNVLMALTINKKLESYGYTLDAPAIRMLSTQTAAELSKTWYDLKKVIENVSGARDFNGELFYKNFPEEVMEKDEAELYINALFYYAFAGTNDELSLAIAAEIRNFVTEEERDRLPLVEEFPRDLKIINLGTEKNLYQLMNARVHSLNMSEGQFEELKQFAEVNHSAFDEIIGNETSFQSKETKVKIAMMLHNEGRDSEIGLMLKDSIDVLRFAAMLSKENGISQNTVDLKCRDPKQQIQFKLKKPEQRLVKNLLNGCNGLYQDIWKQEKTFKALMNRLGTTEKDNCPERVRKAFDNLASGKKLDEYGKPIYNANKLLPMAIEHLNKTGNPDRLIKLAKERPGDFLRSYVSSVVHTKDEYRHHTIEAIRNCVDSESIPMKNLLTVREQLLINQSVNQKLEQGEATAKVYSHHGKHFTKVAPELKLSACEIEQMCLALHETAGKMVEGYQDLGKIYIDEKLSQVKAPGREMRDASGGSVLTPYSTIEMDKNKNILVFGVRWEPTKENPKDRFIDVDLSAHFYNEEYISKGYIDYTNLKNQFGAHSGDFRSIPDSGSATEAIVVDKERMRAAGVRYVVAEVHCFSIPSFQQAGNCRFVYEQKEGAFKEVDRNDKSQWKYGNPDRSLKEQSMIVSGETVFLGDVFEPSQLENCIQLNANASVTAPLVYDVQEDRIYWLDMSLKSHMQSTTRDSKNMMEIIAEIEKAHNNPVPDVKSLMECYSMYNGEIVTSIEEADTIFMRENIDREKLGIKETARVITGFDLDVISKEFSGNDNQSLIMEKEEPIIEEKTVTEPALVQQLRFLREKLNEYPMGIRRIFDSPDFEHERN